MNETQITIISIITIIVGIVILNFTLPDKTENSNVKITGKIISIDEQEKITIIRVATKNPLKIVAFEKIKLQQNDNVEITGKVQQYRGKIEIVADEIKKTK